MCNADVSLLTFDWIPNFHKPWPNFRIMHECANWEAIEKWAWDHYFDGFDESLIKHPDFHPELREFTSGAPRLSLLTACSWPFRLHK